MQFLTYFRFLFGLFLLFSVSSNKVHGLDLDPVPLNISVVPGAVYFTQSQCTYSFYRPYFGVTSSWPFLHQGGCLTSPSENFVLCMEFDGSFRVRSVSTTAVRWSSNTRSGKAIWLSSPGFFIVSELGQVVYSVNLGQGGGKQLEVNDEGDAIIRDSNNKIIWINGESRENSILTSEETINQNKIRDQNEPFTKVLTTEKCMKNDNEINGDGNEKENENENGDGDDGENEQSNSDSSTGSYSGPDSGNENDKPDRDNNNDSFCWNWNSNKLPIWSDSDSDSGSGSSKSLPVENLILLPDFSLPRASLEFDEISMIRPVSVKSSALASSASIGNSDSAYSADSSISTSASTSASTGLINTLSSFLDSSNPVLLINSCLSNRLQTFYFCVESDGGLRLRSRTSKEQIYWDAGIIGAAQVRLEIFNERILAENFEGKIIFSTLRLPGIKKLLIAFDGHLVGLNNDGKIIWLSGQRIYSNNQIIQGVPQYELNQFITETITMAAINNGNSGDTDNSATSNSQSQSGNSFNDLSVAWKSSIIISFSLAISVIIYLGISLRREKILNQKNQKFSSSKIVPEAESVSTSASNFNSSQSQGNIEINV